MKETIAYLAALFGVQPGEVLGALANVLGGLIGALGAALAVILTLNRQRKDERERTVNALAREVGEFSQLAVLYFGVFEKIHAGEYSIPTSHLPSATPMPKPIIYEGNANHIGRLKNPHLIVSFFTRIAQAETINTTLALGFGDQNLDQNNCSVVARVWINIALIGKSILIENEFESAFAALERSALIAGIDNAARRCDEKFPIVNSNGVNASPD